MDKTTKITEWPVELLPHIFFPRQLPTFSLEDQIASEDKKLLELMCSTVQELQEWTEVGGDIRNSIRKTVQVFETWNSMQLENGFNVTCLSKALESLEPGSVMALYFRAQNAGLIMSVPADDCHKSGEAVLSAFSASQSCNTVMSADGTISAIFPGCSYHVPNSGLLKSGSRVLAVHLSALSQSKEELAMPRIVKAGSSHQEVRDVPDPIYITQWLPSLLSAQNSDLCQHFIPVCKKIRDRVIIGKSTLPFRRSGLWMTAKVVLHLTLANEIKNDVTATILYKSIMIKLMTICANSWTAKLNADLGMQVAAKIVRRIVKFQRYVSAEKKVNVLEELKKYFDVAVSEGRKAAQNLYLVHTRGWRQYIKQNVRVINYKAPLDFEVDTIHNLCKLTTYLKSYKLNTKTPEALTIPKLECPPRCLSISSLYHPIRNLSSSGEESLGIVFTDFELNMENLESFYTDDHAEMLRELFATYFIKAQSYYEKDPVGNSRMILTLLNMLMVADKATSKKYPLLEEYRSGIEPGLIQELLLPDRKEMELALRLESYFSIRNLKAKYPSLVEDGQINNSSFGVRYARDSRYNSDMLKLKEKIESDCRRNEADKIAEVERMKKECDEKRRSNSRMSCTYVKDRFGWREHIESSCNKCILEKAVRSTTVSIYEKLLPKSKSDKDGIVFELLIPSEISCLRDMLFYFVETISGRETLKEKEVSGWTNQLSQYLANFPGTSIYVKLHSSTKLFTKTHYNKTVSESSISDFIVENGCNCVYAYNGNSSIVGLPNRVSMKPFCTHNLDSGSNYSKLQFALDGTTHTQNEVMARQNECPTNLRLVEFVEFGSLRAGHNLQWHNIHRAIVQGTLSLETESVFSLICQSIWQAGPKMESGNSFWRQSDQSVVDPKFAAQTLELLNTELDKNSKNWTNNCFLAVVIVLTTRILSLSEDADIKETAMKLLRKCRDVASNWCTNIERLLPKMTLAPKEDVIKMRMNLVQIAALSALTFSVNKNDFHLAIEDESDVQAWLRSITKINDNILLTEASLADVPTLLCNLLRRVRKLGVDLSSYFSTLKFVHSGVEAFLTEQLPNSKEVNIVSRLYESDSNQVLRYETEDSVFQMDFITGRFYVNGKPVGKLPFQISNHSDFQRVFGGTIFEVREVEGTAPESLTTVLKFNNCVYNFSLKNTNTLLVTEIHENGEEYELIPHTQLDDDIAYLLIHGFSHWMNLRTKIIHFRPVNFQDPYFIKFETEGFADMNADYKLDTNTKILTQLKTGWRVVDVNKDTYQNLSKVFERLEHPNQILIFSDGSQLFVELPRMALQFYVDNSNMIHSKEYHGMSIAANQNIFTLIGLQNGLLLKSTRFNDLTTAPIFLVNHGEVTTLASDGGMHHLVNVSTESPRVPAYFAFEVDKRLKRLRAGQSRTGWLYLAYLHAVTASPMPDPFNGMTGTETAVQLLQSPLCWSCEPLEEAGITILHSIANLSPERVYYPEHVEVMERTTFPECLTSVAAQDSFRFIVQKILADSKRLAFLYPFPVPEVKKYIFDQLKFDEKLYLKAYRQHAAMSNEHCQIQDQFLQLTKETSVSSVSAVYTHLDWQEMADVREISQLCSTWDYCTPEKSSILIDLLGNLKKLNVGRLEDPMEIEESSDSDEEGLKPEKCCEDNFHLDAAHFQHRFPGSWFHLYNLARSVSKKNLRSEWRILLCRLIVGAKDDQGKLNNVPFEHIKLLHAVAVNSERFEDISPPQHVEYQETGCFEFNRAEAIVAIKKFQIGFESYRLSPSVPPPSRGEDIDDYKEWLKRVYESLVESQAAEIANFVNARWPTASCDDFIGSYSPRNLVIGNRDANALNAKLASWFANLELRNFLIAVEKQIDQIRHESSVQIIPFNIQAFNQLYSGLDCSKEPSRPICKPLKQLIIDNPVRLPGSEKATAIFQTGMCSDPEIDDKHSSKKALELWAAVKNALRASSSDLPDRRLLAAVGLFPRLTPTTLIPLIRSPDLENNTIRDVLGSITVLWTLEQKSIRCYKYEMAGDLMQFALTKEMENDGHAAWSPRECPEWLLLELEMDIMIRKIQVEVAMHMLKPPNNKSSLMQFNMGEGKTSVVLPLLIASLANGSQLARVTVLKSLFHTNSQLLRVKLGGLLNQRLYTFPCRRDMDIYSKEARAMQELYQECVNQKGFVVTQPEHRLSFQLKSYEKCRSGSLMDASELVNLQQWLLENARDVLDESDEILNVKYQLIYTLGHSKPASGGTARWIVLQKLLKLVPGALINMIDGRVDGANIGECRYMNPSGKDNYAYPRCQVFDPECNDSLCSFIVDDILCGRSDIYIPELVNLSPDKREAIAKFLTYPIIDASTHEEVLSLFPAVTTDDNNNASTSSQLDTVLILRGILACGVLHLGLKKRWRVEYGENPQAKELGRLMAVPYKAKDVASEKTEFGHPDVAIILTQLSYYYSGLTYDQLKDVFKSLRRQPNPEAEYSSWINKMRNVDSSIQFLSGVNLEDYEQWTTILFPSLRMNMAVIDFWLNNYVYPRESRVFDHKLMCSPWDLTSDMARYPVTGFSGTKDTAVLLPIHISQNDLDLLKDTNEKVEQNILREENNHYEALPVGFSAWDILRKLVNTDTTLLLDVGALILELGNVQVAEEWLKLIPDSEVIEAAVYFDSNDRLMVKDRNGMESCLELSPYLTRLDRCVIYLDDAHTRGTDLKMPVGTKGCVTLGKGLTRDKFVQGCMRMRLLGNGHTLQFLASHDVNIEISSIRDEPKWCGKVLRWTSRNSDTVIQDGFVHWAEAGMNYINKKTSHLLFRTCPSTKELEDFRRYGDRCTESETAELMTMYGEFRTEEVFTKILENRLASHERSFTAEGAEDVAQFPSIIEASYRLGGNGILSKCKKYLPNMKKPTNSELGVEQERELEKQEEDQRELQRPLAAQPCEHYLDSELKRLMLEGEGSPEVGGLKSLMPLPKVLRKTELWSIAQEMGWGTNIFATKDFAHVVEILDEIDYVDNYLRPVTWIASWTHNETSTFILLSPYEVNELMPLFRSGKTKLKLHMFAPRLHHKQSTLLTASRLWIPSCDEASSTDYFRGISPINSNLFLFSGNQYFENEEEMTAFCQFTGYITRPPSTEQEREAFENQWTDNGFVKPEFRNPDLTPNCRFDENPEKLILGIIERRHEGYTPKCHVYQVVAESSKPSFE